MFFWKFFLAVFGHKRNVRISTPHAIIIFLRMQKNVGIFILKSGLMCFIIFYIFGKSRRKIFSQDNSVAWRYSCN
jgi:hypothetical protein